MGLVVLNLAPKPWLTAPGVGAEAMDCSSASLAVVTSTSWGGPSLAGDSVGVVRVVTMFERSTGAVVAVAVVAKDARKMCVWESVGLPACNGSLLVGSQWRCSCVVQRLTVDVRV